MKTLVLDRSTERQTFALDDGTGNVRAEAPDELNSRSGEWAAYLAAFLAGDRPDLILVGTGPGSFAGIRAALAYAQGWSVGAGVKTVGLPSPCGLPPPARDFAAVGDARRGLFWIARFQSGTLNGDIIQVERDRLTAAVPNDVPVISPDDARVGTVLREIFADRYLGLRLPEAAQLAAYASAHPDQIRPEPLPIYLNPAVRD